MLARNTSVRRHALAKAALATLSFAAVHTSQATILVWDTTNAAGIFGGAGTWGVSPFWSEFGAVSNGTAPSSWIDGSDAAFTNGATGTSNANLVTVLGTVSANSLQQTGGTNGTFSSGTVVVGAGGIQSFANNDAFGFDATATLSIGAAQTWTLARGMTINGVIAGAGGFTKTNGGNLGTSSVLTIKGANTYTGPTTLAGGQITLDYSVNNNSKIDSASTLNFNGGTLSITGGSFSQGVATANFGYGQNTVSIAASQASGLNITTATHQIGGTANFIVNTGATGSFLTSTANAADGSGIIGGWAVYSGTWFATNQAGVINGSNVGTVVNDPGNWAAAQGTLTNSYVNVNNVGTLSAGSLLNDTTLTVLRVGVAGTGTLNIASDKTLTLSGGALLTQAGLTLNIPTGTLKGSANGELIIQQFASAPTNIGATIADNTGTTAFVKAGTGTGAVVLTGNNTYTGATFVNAGTLQIGAAGTAGAIASSPTINFGGGQLIHNRTDAVTLAHSINGFGTLTQAGTGNLRLTGAGSFAGFINVNAGTLQIDNGSAGSLALAGFGTVNIANGATLTVSSGQLQASSIALQNSGYINLDGGTLALANAFLTASTGTIALNGGAIKSYAVYSTQLGNSTNFIPAGINLRVKNGGAVFDSNGLNTKVLASLVQDGTSTGGLTKYGANLLQLAGPTANTYAGNTVINNGTLQLVTTLANSIPNSPKIILNNNAGFTVPTTGFTLGATQTIAGTGVIGGGTFSAAGATSIVSPGDAGTVGTLTFGTLKLDGVSIPVDVGATADRIRVSGLDSLSFGAGASTITLNNLGGVSAGTYPLVVFNATAATDLTSKFTLSSPTFAGFNVSLVPNSATLTAQSVDLVIQAIVSGSAWNVDADGNWSEAGNWQGGVPNAVDATANFGNFPGHIVTVDAPQTAGSLNFSTATGYTIAGASTLTLDVASGSAKISATAGSHAINAPVVLNDDLAIDTAAGSGVSFGSLLTATGKNISKAGAGTVQFESIRAAGLAVSTGSVKITAQGSSNSTSGTSRLGTLTINSGASLDLSNNSAVITKSGTLIGELRQALQDGRLTSSSAGGGKALGYADNALLGKTLFAGESVSSADALVMFTWSGDADLDGKVNTLDFNALAGAFGGAGVWTQGDFNYDGTVNSQDFDALVGNYGRTTPPPAPSLGSVVPEPASFTVALGMLAMKRRRRAK